MDNIDIELRNEFIDESLEGLGTIADLFIDLEKSPNNSEIVQKIFRPIHSLKGNSSYFGLMHVKALAHAMENLLDIIRKGKLTATPHIVNILLNGTDELISILNRVRNQEDEIIEFEKFQELVLHVESASIDDSKYKEQLFNEILFEINQIENPSLTKKFTNFSSLVLPNFEQLSQSNTSTNKTKSVNKNNSSNFSIKEQLKDTSTPLIANQFIDAFTQWCKNQNDSIEAAIQQEYIQHIELLSKTIGLDDSISRDSLFEKLVQIETNIQNNHDPKKTADKTIRISESKIDGFLAFVGELLTVGEMYNHLQSSLAISHSDSSITTDLRRVNESFAELSKGLQDSIMSIRKVPIQPTMQKLTRIIRDVASANHKRIDTSISGADLAIDKSLIDILEAPLVHMARNAADHGIETIQDRVASGKSEIGHIQIAVHESPDSIVFTISDDGKGLNLELLKKKAVELGIIQESATLSEADIINLMFQSGVSTAKTITDVSGRGVGMDVVKRAIEEAGGTIGVQSKAGHGSQFSLTLPKTVTTQILQGFIVVINKIRYIFPLQQIIRSFKAESLAVHSIPNQGQFVKDGETFVPIIPLVHYFDSNKKIEEIDYSKGMFVIVRNKSKLYAILVDAIDGIQKAVLKNIYGIATEQTAFSGGAVMGDGTVALVVNFDTILESL